jgi:cytidyltransferase-like protein
VTKSLLGSHGPKAARRRKVMVAGCFDLLHASHVVFLNKAAALGDLYVSLGADQSIVQQKNKQPIFSQAERKFLLENLRCVKWVEVVNDPGPLGFVEHLRLIRPDVFVINEDGDTREKRQVCEENGIEYLVFARDHFSPEAPTSTTDIAKGSYIPTRVSLCSGFMDNPLFNAATSSQSGHLVVLPIEAFAGLRDRSGMASSTIKTVRRYFGCRLPTVYPPDRLAEIIFCLENPPDKRGYISGTLDARGIVGTGANLFRYPANAFFPDKIDVEKSEETLGWLERHIYLKHSWDRPADCVVTVRGDLPDFASHAEAMDQASLDCWGAIKSRDLAGLAAALNVSHRAQCALVDNHCPERLRAFIDDEAGATAAMIMGAGGGGYVLFVAERIPNSGIPVRIRRQDL